MFFLSRVACDLPLYCRSNIRMFIVHQRLLHKNFYTTQRTIKFLMFLISTRLRFKWANAKSQIPRHAQWRIDVFTNLVIISVIYKFVSYSSLKHHGIITIMITSSHYHIASTVDIHTSIRPMCIHLCLLSVLKGTHNFMIIGVYSTNMIKSILGEIPVIILRVHRNN